ncbi:MAG: PhnD/SsuA/transferrin family substrate-binding protein [Proteobacteria bacterium]|nr:PhnD/SsuA/transferrin family substrate-binding protein [Pseudomonadota bacterium]
MIASLMMYQHPALVDAHNRYWALIRQHLANAGIDSPETLNQDAEEFAVWNNPELVLSQTCGMPYRTWLHGKVTLIGTPDFGVKDCPAGYYRSAIITRKNDPRKTLPEFREACFAYNQTFSQSGYAAPYWHLKAHGVWFQNRLHVHQHLEAARAVAEDRADIAAIDAVTWRLLRKYEGFTDGLDVLEWTKPTPALPYIAALGAPQKATFNAVANAITALSDEDRALLGLKQIVYIPAEAYLAVKNPNHPS